MFRNRHLNFGYLLVIVVAFVIAMSASCKLAYAEAEKGKPVMIITVDVETGDLISVRGVVEEPQTRPGEIEANKGESHICKPRKIIPAVFVTQKGSNCIIFYFRGKEYEYCF